MLGPFYHQQLELLVLRLIRIDRRILHLFLPVLSGLAIHQQSIKNKSAIFLCVAAENVQLEKNNIKLRYYSTLTLRLFNFSMAVLLGRFVEVEGTIEFLLCEPCAERRGKIDGIAPATKALGIFLLPVF